MNGDDISRPDDSGEALDTSVERWARALAQRTGTRHGFLGWLGKGLWGLAGVSALTPLLPVDRRVQLKDPACSYWKYCYIYGKPCANCGGSDGSCPPGCSESGSSWTGCCYNPSNGCYYYIFYYDCCNCGTCSTSFCENGPGEPAWCAPTYTCTVALQGGKCVSNCIQKPA